MLAQGSCNQRRVTRVRMVFGGSGEISRTLKLLSGHHRPRVVLVPRMGTSRNEDDDENE